LEYVFCDTEKELPETYDYLKQLEVFLGKPIKYLKHDGRGFDELLHIRRGFLPSPQMRWCTEHLKIKPFERYVGNDICYNYIGIRADEINRKGYISTKSNIIPRYPFIEDNIRKEDVIRILQDSGLGLPKYYEWRSRSGCYFCFFQQRIEWVGLLEYHPDLYKLAMGYERVDRETGDNFYWSDNESLNDLMDPQRIEQIKIEFVQRQQRAPKHRSNSTLKNIFEENEPNEEGCLICHL
jgi:3'-phosphoadenosine 5'-phosphosulfate sulfotransferase (PAPS reductase)/FAD synthetase